MTYPKHLFKQPGPYGAGERSYKIAPANSEAEEADLLKKGWFTDKERMFRARFGLDGAEAVIEAAETLEDAIDEVSPATREELETKASELGIPFNSRTKDETLVRRIAEAVD